MQRPRGRRGLEFESRKEVSVAGVERKREQEWRFKVKRCQTRRVSEPP